MKKGFTLIETIIVIMIVAVISMVIAFYLREGFHAWRFLSGQKSISLSTRAALNRVVREVKRAKKNTSISTYTSKEVSFIDVYNNSVTFWQSGSSLMRNSDTLLDDLRNPCGLQFTYLDKDGNVTLVKKDIRVIRCRLTAVKDESKFVIESAARIRIKKL